MLIQVCKQTGKNSVRARKAKTQTQAQKSKQQASTIRNCKYCGKSYPVRECPAFGKQCPKCQKYNHLSSVCCFAPSSNRPKQQSSSQRKRFRPQSNRMHEIDCDTDDTFEVPDDLMHNFVIESAEIPNAQNEIHVTAEVFNKPLEMKLTQVQNVIWYLLKPWKPWKLLSKLTVHKKPTFFHSQTMW